MSIDSLGNEALKQFAWNHWFAIVGLLFLGMALLPNLIKRVPLTTPMLYLGVGMLFSRLALEWIDLDVLRRTALFERLTEIAVIISLFTAGLKLRLPLTDRRWLIPLRLAFLSMAVTVGLIAAVGVFLLKLPLGAAVLLGAILAPTDPVLASDVQVKHPKDYDRLRFSLTGEAGFNDGTAFPFVMLGLGLLGHHELGDWGWRWLAVDVVWAILGGLGIGALLGSSTGRLVVYLRREKREAIGTDDFLALGLIALSYGAALLMHTYGFLAVFAAGLAMRHIERKLSEENAESNAASAEDDGPVSEGGEEQSRSDEAFEVPEEEEDVEKMHEKMATHPTRAPQYLARQMLEFNEALERIGALGVVVLIGTLIGAKTLSFDALWLAPVLFFVIRPIAVYLGTMGRQTKERLGNAKPYVAWFGVRGIGSIYYLFYAVEHGLSEDLSRRLIALTLTIVAISIVVHGASTTMLMNRYNKE